jgi:hypothetical protein
MGRTNFGHYREEYINIPAQAQNSIKDLYTWTGNFIGQKYKIIAFCNNTKN